MKVEGKIVKPRMWFVHRRYITTNRLPEICYITKVTELIVCYRVNGPKGFLTKCTPEYFVSNSFARWVRNPDRPEER